MPGKPFFLIVLFLSAAMPLPAHDLLDPSALDRTADPCQNFYQFACGGWLKSFHLPPDETRYWRQGKVLTDQLEEKLSAILAGPASSALPYGKKLSDFYRSCMNEAQAEKTGRAVLETRSKNLLPKSRPVLARQLAELHLLGVDALFRFRSAPDPKDSGQVIAAVDRGGMSLPDREYYLKEDPRAREVKSRYQTYLGDLQTLAGTATAPAKRQARFILGFEKILAEHSLPAADRRDLVKRFHPMTFPQLKALVPAVDWDIYVQTLGISPPAKLNILEPDFLSTLNKLLLQTSPADLSVYLRYQLTRRLAYYLGGPLQRTDFNFWKSYLRGQKELPPRWKYCTQIIATDMADALGEAYVKGVPQASQIRNQVTVMFADLKRVFRHRLPKLAWMDEATLHKAEAKLDKMGAKIGWPDRWRDYSKLAIADTSFLENELQATVFENHRQLDKIGHPVDRSEWAGPAWDANAFYRGTDNEIVLPLGELVPPVFDSRFSEGANWGSLGGGTIGHEVIHGFDDSGKDLDEIGNLSEWWTPKAKERFTEKSACFMRQAENYSLAPRSPLGIRGKATLGENLADNGGILLGLAYLKEAMQHRPPPALFQGFGELQQYFIAYAQSWCEVITDQQLRDWLLTNFHPPTEFRVNAVLANQPEFAEAFSCRAGSRMAPPVRCTMW